MGPRLVAKHLLITCDLTCNPRRFASHAEENGRVPVETPEIGEAVVLTDSYPDVPSLLAFFGRPSDHRKTFSYYQNCNEPSRAEQQDMPESELPGEGKMGPESRLWTTT